MFLIKYILYPEAIYVTMCTRTEAKRDCTVLKVTARLFIHLKKLGKEKNR